MPRGEWTVITVRVPKELKDQLREHVTKLGYTDISEWIRDVMRTALQKDPIKPEYLNTVRNSEGH